MSTHQKSRLPLRALLVASMIVPPVSFFAALPWLIQQSDALVFLMAGIASVLTIVAGFGLAILQDRQMDEWNRSNARFSSQWGWTAGASLVALLLALPPVRDLIVAWAGNLAQVPNPDSKLVVLTFTFGFMAVVIAQLVCTALLSTAWAVWKSRAARDPA